ncbi:hypothetical protein CGLO_17671 [Colletotrichum gloeosporioides Cg-14]|uniref:Uncharacterized protein n=1 Tax=Colletotrichum gloeosporioides (strain Cg-14) TaxID=1237896 RepID=T0JWA3_COLGC|nr:hypothetical protein CGLO_17671 [Colletotrichum gloeosporioides Cg-14]
MFKQTVNDINRRTF